MILAVGQEMQIYSSSDLKDWTLESKFGEGQGAHGGVWECPDLIELPIEGTELKNGCLFVTQSGRPVRRFCYAILCRDVRWKEL